MGVGVCGEEGGEERGRGGVVWLQVVRCVGGREKERGEGEIKSACSRSLHIWSSRTPDAACPCISNLGKGSFCLLQLLSLSLSLSLSVDRRGVDIEGGTGGGVLVGGDEKRQRREREDWRGGGQAALRGRKGEGAEEKQLHMQSLRAVF